MGYEDDLYEEEDWVKSADDDVTTRHVTGRTRLLYLV
jgi:hypothetical protein